MNVKPPAQEESVFSLSNREAKLKRKICLSSLNCDRRMKEMKRLEKKEFPSP